MEMDRFYVQPGEKPLDHIRTDGGFASIFRTIGCVGDSLSSGEFEGLDEEGNKTYHDLYEYSWGQCLARMTGSRVYNFSRGGMTAREYCDSWAGEHGYWGREYACQAYILALGGNDLYGRGGMEVGGIGDICREDYRENKPTFAGYYGQIIQRLQEISPHAKFFLVTMPREEKQTRKAREQGDGHASLLREMAGFFPNTYVIDLRRYAPVYDQKFYDDFYLGGHMQPCGYVFTAYMMVSYIDYLVRANKRDFRMVGLVGTPYEEEMVRMLEQEK